ncbi:hypothetical protein K493DRAFT_314160 [Basidiobolus meristosporus CBS 931.73]|uniref:G-protein coupled receptors family 1 profile domain-containing protein n=1 Tax=Basidiobolus meristosporus CBS 931.73 TaxID=1314790 RepID=A0A1Y1YH28_9FUNG|nr:hypothetical protein K493DRAFT_314160 [Basidiobolus meristosporus CBS 931.73]|eukprot:ORX97279.1 hypothetical protein K493DRAFT_314160 [Basidiobolus meristosporus CBS 931.73]
MGYDIPIVSQDPKLHREVGLMIASTSTLIAISNIYHSIIMVIHNKHAIFKLNLVAAVLLLANSIAQLCAYFISEFPCTWRYLVFTVSLTISIISLDTILYLKAKSVQTKPWLITIIYVFLRLLHLVVWVKLLLNIRIIKIGDNSCSSLARTYEMLIFIALETIIIIYLTVLFLAIIYLQYKESPRTIYSLLLKDGLIFSLSICFIYFLITIFQLTNLMSLKDLFSIEWAVSSKIMTDQVWRSHLRHADGLNPSESACVDAFNMNLTAIEIK